MTNRILIGDAYVTDGMWMKTVIATNEQEFMDQYSVIPHKFKDIEEVETKNNYKPDDLFVG